ncbi:MAG: M20/M25/M40 family metallo-hydrolase [Clostridiales bacterium]|nr:M20/M25/M40 family metallo-hydrolase [Clostridiales bacterium]
MDLSGIGADIDLILYPYLSVNSETCTDGEKEAERFLLGVLGGMGYFREHPDCFGAFPIPDDPFGRSVCWGLVRGSGERTVVLVHHYDVVNVEDFKALKELAFSPGPLEEALLEMKHGLHAEAAADLVSGEFLFGRGTADMKAGGAVQLALLDRFSKEAGLPGNILLLAVPDEENLSAGMRGAVHFLSELKQRFSLDYAYAIDSEPHQRKDKAVGLLSEGSVGKILAFVYARGFLSHAGKVFEGLNPLSVLARIAEMTELSERFSDTVRGEASPPPTWLYLRDRKEGYDVSMPLGAGGCLSILTLDSGPAEIMDALVDISREAFRKTIGCLNESYRLYCRNSGRKQAVLPWEAKVCSFGELLEEAGRGHGDRFVREYDEKLNGIAAEIHGKRMDFIEAGFLLTEFVLEYIDDLSPRVVLGLVPPYYPNASNIMLGEGQGACPGLAEKLIAFALDEFGQEYERESFFTGISDMSYYSLRGSATIEKTLSDNMPLYGKAYSIPLAEIEGLSMPCINIGPWGKDFHKLSERVCKADLYGRTPALLAKAIELLLS